VALVLAAEPHAVDLELLLEAVGDAFHRVRDERARQAVLRAIVAVIAGARHGQLAVLDLHLEARVDDDFERALGALDLDHAAIGDGGPDALRQRDGRPTDARHHHTSQTISPPTLLRRASRSGMRPF